MKVGIIGTGAIGLGSVALLLSFNHKPILWSPSGKGTHPFEKNKQLDTHDCSRFSLSYSYVFIEGFVN